MSIGWLVTLVTLEFKPCKAHSDVHSPAAAAAAA